MCISNNRRFRPLQKSSSDCLQFPYFNGRFREKKKVVHIISGRLVSGGCCVPKEEEDKEENGSVTSTGQQTDTQTQQGGTWQHTDEHKRPGLYCLFKLFLLLKQAVISREKHDSFKNVFVGTLLPIHTPFMWSANCLFEVCVCALRNGEGGCNLRGFRPYTHLDRIWWGICAGKGSVR